MLRYFSYLLISSAIYADVKCPIQETIHMGLGNWTSHRFFHKLGGELMVANGCKVDYLEGNSRELLKATIDGKINFGMEFWVENAKKIWRQQIIEGHWIPLSEVTGMATQGAFIPRYIQSQYPDLQYVSDLNRYKHLFADPNDSNKGRYYTSLKGWQANKIETHRVKRILAGHFNPYSLDSGKDLMKDLKTATEQKKGIVMYWWTPDSLVAKYDLVQLKEKNPHIAEVMECYADESCQDPRISSWKPTQLRKFARTDFYQKARPLMYQIDQVYVPRDVVMDVLKFGISNNNDESLMVDYFFRKYPNIWSSWDMPSEVKAQIMKKYS